MNIVIIGLGNFGASLAKVLTSMGHDVLGVDNNLDRVEYFKDTIANTICLDATDSHALRLLPIKEADVFVVCIGDDFGVSVMIAALLKKFGVKKVISRESSSIHLTVLNSIGIKYTINPEYESARILAQKLSLGGILNLFSVTDSLKIVDMVVPSYLENTKYTVSSFKRDTHLKIVAHKRDQLVLYSSSQNIDNLDDISFDFHPDDILVVVGDIRDIRKFLQG